MKWPTKSELNDIEMKYGKDAIAQQAGKARWDGVTSEDRSVAMRTLINLRWAKRK